MVLAPAWTRREREVLLQVLARYPFPVTLVWLVDLAMLLVQIQVHETNPNGGSEERWKCA